MTLSLPLPVPQGRYMPAVRHSDLIYTSGFTPRRDGNLIYSEKVSANAPSETYRDAVRVATQNAIWAAQGCLQEGEHIAAILQLNVFLNAEAGFKAHSVLADFASDLLVEIFGTVSIGSRTAIGVETLPADATVEINLVAAVSFV